jgi:hypothetical protein
MKRLALIFLAALLPLQGHAVEPDESYPNVNLETALSSAELAAAFTGKTHRGSYNFLHNKITTFAFEETTRADGTVRHVQQDQVDTGTWSIKADTICFDYDNPGFVPACFEIYTRGNCYYHYQVSTNGVPQFGFTARSAIAGETPNCEPSLV